MSENNKQQSTEEQYQAGMRVDVEHLSVTGHVVFAGRDGSVHVNTGGDVAQNTENTITVAGVETTQAAYDKMVSSIGQVEQKFEEEPTIDEDTKEAARHYLEIIKKLLSDKKKPNPKVFIDSIKSLAKLGPLFASGVAEVFAEPLAAKIVGEMGEGAMNIIKALQARFGS